MQPDNYYYSFKTKTERTTIVRIIIDPPMIVSMLGCSWITNQTQRGPKIVSSKKKRLTSGAVMYLGAMVTHTNGMAIQNIHIKGIINKSLFSNFI